MYFIIKTLGKSVLAVRNFSRALSKNGVHIHKHFFIAVLFCFTFFLSSPSFAVEISHKEFLSTDFIKSFQHKEYEKAIKECDALLKKYPNDPLILRYRALTLEKLHHPAEAINLYHQILAAHPNDEPARLFLGLAYI